MGLERVEKEVWIDFWKMDMARYWIRSSWFFSVFVTAPGSSDFWSPKNNHEQKRKYVTSDLQKKIEDKGDGNCVSDRTVRVTVRRRVKRPWQVGFLLKTHVVVKETGVQRIKPLGAQEREHGEFFVD